MEFFRLRGVTGLQDNFPIHQEADLIFKKIKEITLQKQSWIGKLSG